MEVRITLANGKSIATEQLKWTYKGQGRDGTATIEGLDGEARKFLEGWHNKNYEVIAKVDVGDKSYQPVMISRWDSPGLLHVVAVRAA